MEQEKQSHSQILLRAALRGGLAGYAFLMFLCQVLGRTRRPVPEQGANILLTGTFHSDNWVLSHIRPLAISQNCASISIVSTYPIPPMDKVEPVYPPDWLVRLTGGVVARMLVFFYVGLRTRPDFVGGFHLLFNGMCATLLSRIIGARSIYFCVGGPTETLHGDMAKGWRSENRLFGRLEVPDEVIKQRLLNVVATFDHVVTMGTGAATFFKSKGINTSYHVISGGIEASRFYPATQPSSYDLILVARLAPVKQIDLFLRTIALVKESLPNVSAAIVGDGPLRSTLESLARDLGIDQSVKFAGHQRDVETWLRKARIFVLTSVSEGLALSMMEAMMCGLPVVVSNVGDLGDIVRTGENGYLVANFTPEAFSRPIVELLSDPARWEKFSSAAHTAAMAYELQMISGIWEDIVGSVQADRDGRQQL